MRRRLAPLAVAAILLVLPAAAPAALNVSDNFNGYADGELVTTGSANYFGSGGGAFVVTAATGLGGSKGVVSPNNANNRQVVYKSASGSLADGPVALSIFFTPAALASNYLMEMALYPDNVNAPTGQSRTGARVIFDGGTHRFQTIVNSSGGASDNLPANLIAGNWYFFEVTLTQTGSTLSIGTKVSNASAAGVVGSLIDSATFTGLSSVIVGDAQVYAGFRSSFGGTVDNFGALVPEPAAAALAGLGAALLVGRRRRAA